ncbi:MAG: helix-turn-helix domain-containing protein [Acidobacteria bacterium]|nr:helix-turn-helix domain-containing protein [Acidobacteriota bacterium]
MRKTRPDPKEASLRKNGCLHPRPERVRDELFLSNAFFDPRDLTQVKYEMLRRARGEGGSVSASAARFGLSRVSYYRALRAWEEGGLPALLPNRPGPRGPHKLTGEVVAALRAALSENPALSAEALAGLVRERFGLSVHRRSVERALAQPEKKRR